MNTESSKSQIKILILSGPNLNLLGEREPETYGDQTPESHIETAEKAADQKGMTVEHLQSNHEGALVDAIHSARERCDAIIINPGAFTHYAWAIHDALQTFDGPVIEVHLSNPAAREPWRHTSVVAPVAAGTVAGFGGYGYQIAVDAVSELLTQ